jgi:phosphoribosylamine---glycine ligase
LSRKSKILLIGSGGREHALAWKIRQSPLCGEFICAPGNPGIAELAECVSVGGTQIEQLITLVRERGIDMTVVGPEQPLAAGIVDRFQREGFKIFGPVKAAARLEWSKAYAKDFMQRYGIPTAQYRTFTVHQKREAEEYLLTCPYPSVLKADGLAAGKGVIICSTGEESSAALHAIMDDKAFGTTNDTVVVEEFMAGEEASIFAICDGKDFVTLAPAQDHKRVFDDDRGKNTGGMGAYAPAPIVSAGVLDCVRTTIIGPVLEGMRKEGHAYKGCLYVGLMISNGVPRVVEFNARFGDPETQVVLPLYRGDLVELLEASIDGRIAELSQSQTESSGSAVCVVLASAGYPDEYKKGLPVRGMEDLRQRTDVLVFHAGTKHLEGILLTDGGRVMGVTSVSNDADMKKTIDAAYNAVAAIQFEGMHYRRDIGRRAVHQQQ